MSASLWVLHVDGLSERLMLDPTRRFVIGRGEEVDFRLDRPGVDRRHVELVVHDGGWWIQGDSRTTSGTWLEGRFVLESRRLVEGDVIQIGGVDDVLFRFSDPRSKAAPTPSRFDRQPTVTPDEAARRGLPRVGLRVEKPDGLMVSIDRDDRSWLTITSPPGGGPHARFLRGPCLDDRPNAPRVLQQHVAPREMPDAIASGRVLAFGGTHPAIAWVFGESLGRMATLAIAAPLAETPGEALVLAFSVRSAAADGPSGLEPWLVLTHPTLAPLLRAEILRP
ncbi:MAG: FHA domain-containing protein [Deltaproteobacteria bacterium]|nr:FHA domain-containing protein [Deltaproteobacteria bacterium]